MPSDAQPLITLGPFIGIDTHVADDRESDDYAKSSVSVDTARNIGSMMVALGRQAYFNFPNINGPITSLVRYDVGPNLSYFIAQGTANASTGLYSTGYYGTDGTQGSLSGITTQFVRGVQFAGVIYLDNGQQVFFGQNNILNSALWQYAAPSGFTGSLYPSTVNSLAPGTYSYAFVRIVALPLYGGTIYQQTTPYFLPSNAMYVNDQYGNSSYQSGTLVVATANTQAIQLSGPFAGTTPDGYQYATDIYRMSSNTNVFQRLATEKFSGAYFDATGDSGISGNQQLVLNRDQPPTGLLDIGPTGAATNLNNPIESSQNRMWVLAREQNSNTYEVPQAQLWYSQVGQGWSFDGSLQVNLVDNASVLLQPQVAGGPLSNYGDIGSGVTGIGSNVMVFGRKSTNMVYGTDETNYVLLPLFKNVGCIAPLSIIKYAEGKVAWLSTQGFCTYDQSSFVNISTEAMYNYLLTVPSQYWPSCVGFFRRDTLFWSFPGNNVTLMYYIPTKAWGSLPYACTAATFDSSAAVFGSGYGQIVAARYGTSFIDFWQSTETDLGLAQTATWTSPYSTSKAPYAQKTYRHLAITAPPQVATVVVTLTVDGGYGLQSPKPWTSPVIDLSQAPFTNIVNIGQAGCKGYAAQVTVALTNNASNVSTPAEIWDVTIGGTIDRTWAANT